MNIGIIGAPEVGKDLIAEYLCEKKGYKRLAFADEIKKGFYKLTGYSEEEFKKARGEAFEEHIREGLWKYSRTIMAKHGSNFFIEPVISNIKASVEPVVVTDIRTKAELEAVLSTREADTAFDFRVFMIVRNPKKELSKKTLSGTKLALCDIMGRFPIFWNDTNTLDEAYREFERFYTQLKGGEVS